MEKRVDAGLLLSLYGPMLTERQRETLRLYYEDDYSLSEIAALLGITRQGAHDTIRRGEQQLIALEGKLGLRARWTRVRTGLTACRAALDEGNIHQAKSTIDTLLQEEEQDGV